MTMAKARLEESDQRVVVTWARAWGVALSHSPNEALDSLTPAQRGRMVAIGVQAGIPDLQVYSLLPNCPEARGLGLELKAANGRLSAAQARVRDVLRANRWLWVCVRGAALAKAVLYECGLADGLSLPPHAGGPASPEQPAGALRRVAQGLLAENAVWRGSVARGTLYVGGEG